MKIRVSVIFFTFCVYLTAMCFLVFNVVYDIGWTDIGGTDIIP